MKNSNRNFGNFKKIGKKLKNFERFEKIDIFNDITSAMFNAYLISTLKFEKTKYFWVIQKSEKKRRLND